MSRTPSVETELRNTRRELRRIKADFEKFKVEMAAYRKRATQAEQDAATWRARFDELLFRRQEKT